MTNDMLKPNLNPIKMLLVEDDSIDRLAFTRSVKFGNLPYDYTIACSLLDAIRILETQTFEIAILDYNLGDGFSSELFPILKAQGCPFIISTGSGDEATAARLMGEGASDYLIKDPDRNYLKVLPATVNKTMTRFQSEEQLRLLGHAMQQVKDCIYIVDDTGKLFFTNASLNRLSNVTCEAVIDQPIEALNQPGLSARKHLDAAYTHETSSLEVEVILQDRNGNDVPMLLSESLIQDGSRQIKVGLLRDISLLKNVESALREVQENLEVTVQNRTNQLQEAIASLQQENQSRLVAEESLRISRDLLQKQQEFLRLVIDSIPNSIFVKDWEGRHLLANQAAADFYDTTVEAMIGKTDAELHPNFPEAHLFVLENRKIIETQKGLFIPEERIHHLKLGNQWYQWQKIPIQIPDQSIPAVLGIGVNISLRKVAEQSLQASEQRYLSLAAAAPVGIFRTDNFGRCLYVNDRWCQIAGLTPEEASGEGWRQHIYPDDRDRVSAEWDASIREKRPFRLEYRFLRPDNVITWAFGQSVEECDPDGQIIGFVGTITDITDRKHAEMELADREQTLSTLISNFPGFIYRVQNNHDYTPLFVSQGVTAISGYQPDEYLIEHSISFAQQIHPLDSEMVRSTVQQALSSRLPYECEFRILTKMGQEKWVWERGQGIFTDDGTLKCLEGFVIDVTDRKIAEDELFKISERLRKAQQIAKIGNWEMNHQTRGLYWSDEIYNIYEINSKETDVFFDSLIHPDDRDLVHATFSQHLNDQIPYSIVHRLLLNDGSIKYVQEHCESIFNQDGEPIVSQGTVQDITNLKQTEKELEQLNEELEQRIQERTAQLMEQEALLKDFLDDANDLIQSVLLENGQFDYVNRAWSEALGYSEDEINKLTIFDIIHPKYHVHCQALIAKMLKGNISSVDYIELTFLTKDRQEIIVEGSLNCRYSHGLAVATQAIFRNVTDRKMAEEALRRSELTNRIIVETLPDLLIQMDQDGYYSRRIQGGIDIQNQSLDLNTNIPDVYLYLPPDLAELRLDYTHRAIESGRLQIYEQTLEVNGSISYEEVRIAPVNEQEVLIIVRDITERKKVEQSLLESRRFLQTVLDTFPLSVFWKDKDSIFLGCNQNFLRDSGLTSISELIGKTDFDMPWGQTHAAFYRRADQDVMESNSPKLGIVEHLTIAQGKLIWSETNKLPLHDLDGKVIGVLGTSQNITHRKQIEDDLQRINKELERATRLKDEFLANMSHELRTPLNAILGLTEALLEKVFGSLNEKQVKSLNTVEKSATHLLSLINDILDLAKIESGQIELEYTSVDLTTLCNSSLSFVKQQALKKRIQLDTRFAANIPELWVDERRIRQVLINLLTNAVKFTPEGGRITLEAYRLAENKPDSTGDFVRIAIIDTGIGIAQDNIKKLFKPFVQIDSTLNRQYSGTGLGLALVKQIVELHGGDVDLTSELGVGSCFAITLPCVNQPNPLSDPTLYSPANSIEETHPSPQTETYPLILLAEDNDTNIFTVTNYLEEKGYRLILAKDGLEAVFQAQIGHPDIVLMDIQMPGMDGLEAIQKIRNDPDLVNVPIIALTALAMPGDRERCLQAGATEYLSKPVRLKALHQMIQSLLTRTL